MDQGSEFALADVLVPFHWKVGIWRSHYANYIAFFVARIFLETGDRFDLSI